MVVVGTCWDLGAISAIPQLLRWLESTRGLRMSEQPAVCRVTGGASVGAPIIEATPEKMRSVDGYTPPRRRHMRGDRPAGAGTARKISPLPRKHTQLNVMSLPRRRGRHPCSPGPSGLEDND